MPPSSPVPLWKSRWLDWRTLLAFTILFTLMWVTLIVLWRHSLVNDGIAITLSTSHYTWTYGPTVIITAILALWRRVEYQCKLAQPWKEMKYNSVDSSKGILLDYVSPTQITTFYRAFRNRHWGTALSVLTFALLKVAMLLSTVLLVSRQTSGSSTVPLIITSKLNGSDFWNEVQGSYSVFAADGSVLTSWAYRWNEPALISAYKGIVNEKVKEPPGLQEYVVFQTFEVHPAIRNTTQIVATVSAFVPNITCEAPVLTYGEIDDDGDYITLALDSPTCSAGHFSATLKVRPCYGMCNGFTALRVNCSEAADTAELLKTATNIPIDKYTPYDLRYALIAIDSNYTINPDHSWTGAPIRTAAVICKFDYSLQNVTATVDLATGSIHIQAPNKLIAPSQSLNLTGIEMGELLFCLMRGEDMEIWDLTALSHGYPTGPELAYDPEILPNITAKVYSGLAAQLIHQKFVVADNTPIIGTGVRYENRLHVQPFTLWGMVSIFIFMSFLPPLIAFSMNSAAVSINPSSIAALATILANSPSLQRPLARAGSLRTSEMRSWLDGYIFKYGLDGQGRFQLIATGSPPLYHKSRAVQQVRDESSLSPEDIKVKGGNWVPLATRYPFLSLTFGLPILGILTLEALYQVSRHNYGLAQTDYVALPYIQYTTSFVILVIATTFNSVDFIIQSCSPFHALSTRQKVPGRGMVDNFLDKLPPEALYHAVRNKYIGAALSNAATTIGGILTIVSSGLWVVQSATPFTTDIQTSPTTTWNLRWNESAIDDGGASVLLNSIDWNETISPGGVWGDLVFPDLDLINYLDEPGKSTFTSTNSTEPPYFAFEVPALRPLLALVDLPKGCHGGPTGDRNYLWLNLSLLASFELSKESFWIGGINDEHQANILIIHLGPWDPDREDFGDIGDNDRIGSNGYFGETIPELFLGSRNHSYGSTKQPDNPNGCPSISIIFGYAGLHDLTASNITVLLCSQKIQEVQAEVLLRTNETGRVGQTSLLSPPITNESTAIYLTNGTDGVDSFNYRVEPHFFVNFSGIEYPGLPGIKLDPFFYHIFKASNGTPLGDMAGTDNVEVLKDAVNRLYNRYMVQVMNTPIFRKPLDYPHSSSPQLFNGTAHFFVSRLTIDFTSKLTLQIMLAVMLLLEAVSLTQIKIRGLLPRNPCSIASVMGLLGGSTICRRSFAPRKGGRFTQKDLREAFCQDTFRMGWWHDGDKPEAQSTTNGGRGAEGIERSRFGIDVGEPTRLGFYTKT
ncbi:hypothetical protein NUW58_g4295 [Xylaria curta]|uniref:Uncharacterized protein n=1 Tax=Xylaria curta TaxID=42375 RepID=A0ACC1P9K3_9PEZI|nr:hypothetical protein NUW58_g4295 [Xylaria curta]